MAGPRRRYRRRLPKPVRIGELVDKRARRWKFQALGRMEVIRSKWLEAAGEFVAAHVVPVRLVRRQLRLAVEDASWAAEMAYLGPAILERLKELLPGRWVDELKAVQGEPIPPEAVPPSPLEIPEATPEMRAKAARLAAQVGDPELAARVERAVLASLRRLDPGSIPAVDTEEPNRTPTDGEDP